MLCACARGAAIPVGSVLPGMIVSACMRSEVPTYRLLYNGDITAGVFVSGVPRVWLLLVLDRAGIELIDGEIRPAWKSCRWSCLTQPPTCATGSCCCSRQAGAATTWAWAATTTDLRFLLTCVPAPSVPSPLSCCSRGSKRRLSSLQALGPSCFWAVCPRSRSYRAT